MSDEDKDKDKEKMRNLLFYNVYMTDKEMEDLGPAAAVILGILVIIGLVYAATH